MVLEGTMIKEDLEITVKETQPEVDETIQEETYEITLLGTTESLLTTNHINGYLESITLFSSTAAQIKISAEDIPVFESQSFVGTQVLPIRYRAMDNKGEGFMYSQERIALNELLTLMVKGAEGTIVRLKIRWN